MHTPAAARPASASPAPFRRDAHEPAWSGRLRDRGDPNSRVQAYAVSRYHDNAASCDSARPPLLRVRSGSSKHPLTKQVEVGAAVHLPLEQLQPVDLALGL